QFQGCISEGQSDGGADQHDRHHQSFHPHPVKAGTPSQGIGQQGASDRRIPHQGREGGSPQAEGENGGGGASVKGFQRFAHFDDGVHPNALGKQDGRGANHHHGGDQAQTEDSRVTFPHPLLDVLPAPSPFLNQIGLVKGADDGKRRGQGSGDQREGPFRNAGDEGTRHRRRIRPHRQQGEEEGGEHETDQAQHRLFQKPIEVFQKQRSDRQEREKKRPEGGGGSGQRSEGDSRPHRIAGLKGRGDQKRTRPDENRRRRSPLPPDEGEEG